MEEDFLLLNGGPVPMSDKVADAATDPMISHRSSEFEEVYERAKSGLEYVFTQSTLDERVTNDDGEAIIFNGTATMGMESVVSGALTDDADEVVALVNGLFGRRFAQIADRYTDRVERVEVEWGEPFSLDAVEAAISDDTAVVTMVHSESTAGLLNPVGEVGEIARNHDALFVVDGVTSIGGDEFRIDDWNVDVAITGTQKALAAPPGLSSAYLTERALDRMSAEGTPYYQDVEWYLDKAEQRQTPFTSAVTLFRGLAAAVDEIREETLPTRIERHRRQARANREAFRTMGLELFANPTGESDYSNTLTAVNFPEGLSDPDRFFDALGEYNVSVSSGHTPSGDQTFRVSNMGNLSDKQVRRGIDAVGKALTDLGFDVNRAEAVRTAERILRC